jgi:type III secretion protein N (ATPase)
MIAVARGRVQATSAHAIEARMPSARLGESVAVVSRAGTLIARIDAVRNGGVRLTPRGATAGVAAGDAVVSIAPGRAARLGLPFLGCALDPGGIFEVCARPFARAPVDAPLWTGIRAIDALLTLGRGARIGVFGPPGTGKSTLLEAIAAGTTADAVVIGLVGERGREAERWLRALDGRTSIVCATGERTAAERVHAAEIAFAQAEALRERGLDVLLIVDSLARVAAGAREIALGLGEIPGRGGYPPGVFSDLARLVERAGRAAAGSISLVATVLSEAAGDDDPLALAVRSLLDGHIVLDAGLAQAGRFPAIDVPRSVSRTMPEVAGPGHRAAAGRLRAALALLAESADLRAAGIALPGRDPAPRPRGRGPARDRGLSARAGLVRAPANARPTARAGR